MFETMIIKLITFFSDIGNWFTRNFLPHNPHEVKEKAPDFVGEFMIQPIEPVTKVEEKTTPEVQTAKEFMQQSIETVSKAEEELKARIIEDMKHVEDVVAQYKAELVEFVETETKVAEKLVEEVEEVIAEVAEFVEEKAKKVKKSTRKKTKKEQED